MSSFSLLTVPAAFSADECKALLAVSEAAGYRPVTIEGKLDGPFGFAVSDGCHSSRAAVEDLPLTAALWRRLQRFVPERIDGRSVVGFNERLRFYRYDAGQDFSAHTDGYYERANGERSFLTLMMYLNEDFAGGETFFLEPARRITPRTGTLVLFRHQLWHGGRQVLRGRKYILRTDVMYEAPPEPAKSAWRPLDWSVKSGA